MDIKLGGKPIKLEAPSSYAIRTEVWLLASENRTRGLAAALGVCWRGLGRPKVQYAECQYNPAVYGARVLDELVERGLPLADILRAGGEALRMMAAAMASAEDVSAAEGNSDAEQEGSTG